MVAFADVIDFLLRLLTDEDAQAEFDKDPQGTLAGAGLEGVTAADIRDARLQLADSGAVSGTDDGRGSSHGDDPVREIGYTTQHYVADEHAVHHGGGHHASGGHGDMSLVARGDTFVTIDDRDTLFFQSISDDDVTINQDNSVNNQTAIQDNDVNGGDEVIDIDVTGGVGADPDESAAAPEAPAADLAAVSGPAELDSGIDPEPEPDLAAVSGPSEIDPGIDPGIDSEVDEQPADVVDDVADDADADDLAADDALTV